MLRRKRWLSKIVFHLFVLISSLAKADVGEIYEIQLRWQAVPGAAQYKIQIGSSPSFETSVEEGMSSEAAWMLRYRSEKVKTGNSIYYRIASVNEKGERGEYSSPQVILLPQIENKEEISSSLLWGGNINAGLSSFIQKSAEAELKSVSSDSMTWQQRFSFQLDLYQSLRLRSASGTILEEYILSPRWSLYFQIGYAAFDKVLSPKSYQQPKVSDFGMSLDLLRWSRTNSSWHLGYGISLNRSFRWFKTGPESVTSQGAFSAGPAIYLVWRKESSFRTIPSELGTSIGVPLTGLFTSGQAGGGLAVWSEWSVFHIMRSRLGIRLAGNVEFFQWSTPAQTTVLTEAFWGALTYHLGPQ